jgi:hypothetical protein
MIPRLGVFELRTFFVLTISFLYILFFLHLLRITLLSTFVDRFKTEITIKANIYLYRGENTFKLNLIVDFFNELHSWLYYYKRSKPFLIYFYYYVIVYLRFSLPDHWKYKVTLDRVVPNLSSTLYKIKIIDNKSA